MATTTMGAIGDTGIDASSASDHHQPAPGRHRQQQHRANQTAIKAATASPALSRANRSVVPLHMSSGDSDTSSSSDDDDDDDAIFAAATKTTTPAVHAPTLGATATARASKATRTSTRASVHSGGAKIGGGASSSVLDRSVLSDSDFANLADSCNHGDGDDGTDGTDNNRRAMQPPPPATPHLLPQSPLTATKHQSRKRKSPHPSNATAVQSPPGPASTLVPAGRTAVSTSSAISTKKRKENVMMTKKAGIKGTATTNTTTTTTTIRRGSRISTATPTGADGGNVSIITVPWCPPAIGKNAPTCCLIVAAETGPHTTIVRIQASPAPTAASLAPSQNQVAAGTGGNDGKIGAILSSKRQRRHHRDSSSSSFARSSPTYGSYSNTTAGGGVGSSTADYYVDTCILCTELADADA